MDISQLMGCDGGTVASCIEKEPEFDLPCESCIKGRRSVNGADCCLHVVREFERQYPAYGYFMGEVYAVFDRKLEDASINDGVSEFARIMKAQAVMMYQSFAKMFMHTVSRCDPLGQPRTSERSGESEGHIDFAGSVESDAMDGSVAIDATGELYQAGEFPVGKEFAFLDAGDDKFWDQPTLGTADCGCVYRGMDGAVAYDQDSTVWPCDFHSRLYRMPDLLDAC